MHIRTLKYVSWTDLTKGLNELLMDSISSSIGDSVTWGDARHTLIFAFDILDNINVDDSDSNDEKELIKRLESLDGDIYICMET